MAELQGVRVVATVAADPHVVHGIDEDAVVRLGPVVALTGAAPVLEEVALLVELQDGRRRMTARLRERRVERGRDLVRGEVSAVHDPDVVVRIDRDPDGPSRAASCSAAAAARTGRPRTAAAFGTDSCAPTSPLSVRSQTRVAANRVQTLKTISRDFMSVAPHIAGIEAHSRRPSEPGANPLRQRSFSRAPTEPGPPCGSIAGGYYGGLRSATEAHGTLSRSGSVSKTTPVSYLFCIHLPERVESTSHDVPHNVGRVLSASGSR